MENFANAGLKLHKQFKSNVSELSTSVQENTAIQMAYAEENIPVCATPLGEN